MLRRALLLTPLLGVASGWGAAGQARAQSVGDNALPHLGDGHEMSLSAERRLGDRIARSIYQDPDYLDDPLIGDYLQALWQPLLQTAASRGDMAPDMRERFAWRLVVSRERSVNAFALPGGYLGVHLGLLGTVTQADELASVLAHEISHVTQRHIARLIARQKEQGPWVLAAMVLGALAASAAGNADIGNAAIVGGQAVAAQSRLNFSRDMEREADRVGYALMTNAGFNGLGFVTMFDKLQQAARLNDDGAFPYLRSHPLTSERLADMRTRQPLDAPAPSGPTRVSAQWHGWMAARARTLSESSIDRLQAIASQGGGADRVYGAVLASARLRDKTAALQGLDRLQPEAQRAPDLQAVWPSLALDVLLDTDSAQSPAGLQRQALAQLCLASPRRSALLLGSRAALAMADGALLQSAGNRLQTWVALSPGDGPAWQALAGVHQALGRTLPALRAEAEARVAVLDATGALDRLRAAQTLGRSSGGRLSGEDHFELSIVDARIREIEAATRALALEDKG